MLGMKLIVVRHAKAKERDAKRFPDDSQRPLSANGRREFVKFARRIPRWLEAPSLVLASGWTRAWDTADILQSQSKWPAAKRCEALQTEGGFAAVEVLLQLLDKNHNEKCVALVGHEPVLGELISRLMGASEYSIDFAKGAVAVIEITNTQPLRGQLQALVSPSTVLNRLKKRR
ncbi:MAG: hypothetical protein EXS12_06875 [Phycisphaerales bacterium]|nr:hypothetical protein [Phycisphaerales bacterium]